jgi:hypothetical protein
MLWPELDNIWVQTDFSGRRPLVDYFGKAVI